MRARAWVLFALALAGILLLWWVVPRIADWLTKPQVTVPGVVGTVDTIPDTVAMQQRPETTTTLPERLVTHTVKGHVAVSTGTPDTAGARRFADAVARADAYRDTLEAMRARGDTSTPPPKPKAVLPTTWGRYREGLLQLGLTRSDGSVLHETLKVSPRFEWYSGFDAGSDTLPVIRADRWFVRLARQTVKCAPRAAVVSGASALVDRDKPLRGALLGGVAALVGCLAG